MIFKEKYPELIKLTRSRFPDYEEIDFRRLLEYIYPDRQSFINDHGQLSAMLNDKKVKEKDFETFGTLCEKRLDELFFYQPFVGIQGPRHTDINAPVSFLQVQERTILWNGYHRTLIKLSEKQESIHGYLLVVQM